MKNLYQSEVQNVTHNHISLSQHDRSLRRITICSCISPEQVEINLGSYHSIKQSTKIKS